MSIFVVAKLLGKGLAVSANIFFLTLIFSLPLGLLVCYAQICRFWIVRAVAKVYISVMRGTPLMLQLLVVYFGPFIIFGAALSSSYRFPAAIIAFVINYAAYFAEIYRGGLLSIPIGQYEAAQVLGYSSWGRFFKIILPQLARRVLPGITNEVITLIKDTSLAFVIAVSEMFTTAQMLSTAQTSMLPLAMAGLFYYIFNAIVAYLMGRLEKKMDYFR